MRSNLVISCAHKFFGKSEEPKEPPSDPKVLQETPRTHRETSKAGTWGGSGRTCGVLRRGRCDTSRCLFPQIELATIKLNMLIPCVHEFSGKPEEPKEPPLDPKDLCRVCRTSSKSSMLSTSLLKIPTPC